MKYNQATLNKMEKIITESQYVIRYERGTFQSGYCILETKKVLVLNKFLNAEGRINILIDLMPQININVQLLSDDSQLLYFSLIKKTGTEPGKTADKTLEENK